MITGDVFLRYLPLRCHELGSTGGLSAVLVGDHDGQLNISIIPPRRRPLVLWIYVFPLNLTIEAGLLEVPRV
jgi:hypothetical protein